MTYKIVNQNNETLESGIEELSDAQSELQHMYDEDLKNGKTICNYDIVPEDD